MQTKKTDRRSGLFFFFIVCCSILNKNKKRGTHMDNYKQALAKRCIDSGKTPCRLDRCNEVAAWGKKISLSEVKPGQLITISGSFTSIEKLASQAFRSGPQTIDESRTLMVTDVVHMDGTVIIETPSAIYSTMDFAPQWGKEYKKELINSAMLESGRWHKNNTKELLREFGINLHKITNANLERVEQALLRKAEELGFDGPQHGYTDSEIEQFRNAAMEEVEKINHEIGFEEGLKWAEKLSKMHLPILRAESFSMRSAHGHSLLYSYPHSAVADNINKSKFPMVLNIDGRFSPMFAPKKFRPAHEREDTFPSITVRDVIRPDDRHYIVITDNAIFTNLEMQEQLRAILEREGLGDLLERDGMQASEYIASSKGGKLMLSNPVFNSIDWLVERCAESGVPVEHVNISANKTSIIDSNGNRKPMHLTRLYPGAKIEIEAEFTDMRTGETNIEKRFVEVKEIVNGLGYTVFNTGDGLISTRDFSQELEMAEQQIGIVREDEGPVIGDN
jgi:hypothetical protein